MSQKKSEQPPSKDQAPRTPSPGDPPRKKKLSLDITDVSEVLERKISP